MIIDSRSLKNGSLSFDDCYYGIIIAVSKRAREIVDEQGSKSFENPVDEAIDEFEHGKFVINLPDKDI